MGLGHETVNFEGQGVKGQGHTRPQIDLEVLEAMSVICLHCCLA